MTGVPDTGTPATPAPREVPAVRCHNCNDTGHACENHPDRPWGYLCCNGPVPGSGLCGHGACHCGGAGMPCPACCSPIPEDGRHSIADAFTPDWMRHPARGRPVAPLLLICRARPVS